MEIYICVILFTLLFSGATGSLESEFANSAYLDGSETYKLYWSVNENTKTVYFAVKVKTLGWVGFGISAGKGNMVGSDVMMGWVKDGRGVIQDGYADAKALPSVEEQQDYELDGANEEQGYTIIKFHRKFDTCDERDRKIEAGTTRVVWAYHTADPTSNKPEYHQSNRGARSLAILNVFSEKPKLPDNLQYFDVRHNVTIPGKETTYMCMAYEFPQMKDKHHIVKIDPVITPINQGRVHHMLVYSCLSSFPHSNVSVVGECYERNMPPDVSNCAGEAVIAAWGIGGSTFYFPKHVGFPIGAGVGPRYVVLEIHYDNPKKTAGVEDYSGLRFYYTDKTRQYDAGMLWAGWMPYPGMVVPPRQLSWITTGYCSGQCTKAGFVNSTLDGGGIKVFASFLHTHLQGIRTWTKHVRNGVELPEIARDDNYDFNYQEYQVSRKETHVKPGDDIIQMCDYQTKDKNKAVLGGLGTKQEMCMSFMMYYPKVDLTKCLSGNDVRGEFVRRLSPNVNVTANITWSEDQVKMFRQLLDNTTHVGVSCLNDEGKRYNIRWVPKPQITKPLKPEHNVCKDAIATASITSAGSYLVFMTSVITAIYWI